MPEYVHIRPPAVAGTFYPGEPEELRRRVKSFMEQAGPGAPELRVRALIAPHAGYEFSGAVAGHAFAAVNRPFRRVLNLGPSHYVDFQGIAAVSFSKVSTPLGSLPVENGEVFSELVQVADRIHEPEHALETHWPFLQAGCETPMVIPWLTGRVKDSVAAEAVAAALDEESLLAVSSDLSHFLSDDEARLRDEETARAIEALEPEGIDSRDACGHTAVRALLTLARERSWQAKRLVLCNSGDVTGDHSRVVGYGAWVFGERV